MDTPQQAPNVEVIVSLMLPLEWHVGDVIRKLREDKRWTQLRLGKESDLDKSTIVRVEENAPGVRRETYELIAKALGCSVGALFMMIPPQRTWRPQQYHPLRNPFAAAAVSPPVPLLPPVQRYQCGKLLVLRPAGRWWRQHSGCSWMVE